MNHGKQYDSEKYSISNLVRECYLRTKQECHDLISFSDNSHIPLGNATLCLILSSLFDDVGIISH